MAGEVEAAQEQTLDAWRLRTLVRESLRKSSQFELMDARRTLTRAADHWSDDEPTDLLRVAAVSRRVNDKVDSLWGELPERMRAIAAAPEPWAVPYADAIADIAQLVIFEQLDYLVACRPFLDLDLRLRSLLTERDDINALTASMRLSSMLRLELRNLEDLLRSWKKHTSSIAEAHQS